MSNNYVDKLSLVPRISKSQFDHAAECFLRDTCKEALEHPMPVPIMEIARKKLGLRVLTDYHLSEDLSILGMCCFTTGVVDVYDKEEDEFREMVVRRGTILIDPDTYFLRSFIEFNRGIGIDPLSTHTLNARRIEKNIRERVSCCGYGLSHDDRARHMVAVASGV